MRRGRKEDFLYNMVYGYKPNIVLLETDNNINDYKIIKTMRLKDNEREGNQLFLRIGDNFGTSSRVGLDDEWKAETGKMFESGVSVWFLRKLSGDGDRYMISKPLQEHADYGLKNYFENMFIDVLFKQISLGEVYVVTGKLIPIETFPPDDAESYVDGDNNIKFYDYLTGTDGEPLLEVGTVKVVERVSLIEFFEKFYINNGYTVKDLFLRNVKTGWVDNIFSSGSKGAPKEFVDYVGGLVGRNY